MTQPCSVAVEAAVNDLKNTMKERGDVTEVIQATPVVSLLSEIVSCTRNVAMSVEELAIIANFRRVDDGHNRMSTIQPILEHEDAYHVINIKQ